MADNRAQRTRSYLRHALLELLAEKPFEKLSVREVVDRAGLSRKAFYNHYADINQLAVDCFLHEVYYHRADYNPIANHPSRADFAREGLDGMAHIIAFLGDHPRFGEVVLTAMGSSPYFAEGEQAEIDSLVTYFGDEAPDPGPVDDLLDRTACARYIRAGWTAVARAWITGGMRESVEAVTKECVLLGLQCSAVLRGGAIDPEDLQAIREWRWEG